MLQNCLASHREKDTSNWKSEEDYSRPMTTKLQKFETKESKKRTLNSDTKMVFLWEIVFVLYNFSVSVQ